jgi:hypothetical protein
LYRLASAFVTLLTSNSPVTADLGGTPGSGGVA